VLEVRQQPEQQSGDEGSCHVSSDEYSGVDDGDGDGDDDDDNDQYDDSSAGDDDNNDDEHAVQLTAAQEIEENWFQLAKIIALHQITQTTAMRATK
jgi:hypothetical protein